MNKSLLFSNLIQKDAKNTGSLDNLVLETTKKRVKTVKTIWMKVPITTRSTVRMSGTKHVNVEKAKKGFQRNCTRA